MTPPAGREPDLDRVLDAVVALIEAATYADAVRRANEVTIARTHGHHPAGASALRVGELRAAAGEAEAQARTALYDALDHERTMRLIPRISAARYEAAARGEAAYEALAARRTADGDGS